MEGLCPLVSSGGAWDNCRGSKCALWDNFRGGCMIWTVGLTLQVVAAVLGDLVELGKKRLELELKKGE